LAKQNQLPKTGPNAVHRHDGICARAELARVLVIDQLWTYEQELATIHGRVLFGRNYRTFNSGEEHLFC
jgi:hypothetical protein